MSRRRECRDFPWGTISLYSQDWSIWVVWCTLELRTYTVTCFSSKWIDNLSWTYFFPQAYWASVWRSTCQSWVKIDQKAKLRQTRKTTTSTPTHAAYACRLHIAAGAGQYPLIRKWHKQIDSVRGSSDFYLRLEQGVFLMKDLHKWNPLQGEQQRSIDRIMEMSLEGVL